MRLTTYINKQVLKRKLITAVFITASLAAFATLGGDKDKRDSHSKKLLVSRPGTFDFKTFTLKSRYNYRGSTVLKEEEKTKYIMVNNVVSYQKGNSTYILPMKKKVLLDKVKFNPASSTH